MKTGIPEQVRRALDHVRSFHPEVVRVVFNSEGRWQYTDEDFNCPQFDSDLLDDRSILEDAAEAVTSFPAVFEHPEYLAKIKEDNEKTADHVSFAELQNIVNIVRGVNASLRFDIDDVRRMIKELASSSGLELPAGKDTLRNWAMCLCESYSQLVLDIETLNNKLAQMTDVVQQADADRIKHSAYRDAALTTTESLRNELSAQTKLNVQLANRISMYRNQLQSFKSCIDQMLGVNPE